MQATDLACYGGVAALHGGNLGFQRIELLLNALPLSGEGLVVSICQGVVGRQDSDGGDDYANARDASEAYPVSLRLITGYRDICTVDFFDFHFFVLVFCR
jgi:hypothetical protein